MRRLAVVVAGLMVGLAACSSSSDGTAAAPTESTRTVHVKLVDGGCDQPTYAAKAGTITFVAENSTTRDQEFEILAPGPSIIAEKDPIEVGKRATLTESLSAGDYEVRCALGSDAKTSTLTVTGKGGGATLKVDQAALDAAVAQYKTFVLEQSDILEQKTQEGPNDPEWTGWHRIEKGLWQDNSTEGLTPFAQKLVTDTNGLIAEVQALTTQPGVMTNGAAALIEEDAQGKITGEEERYSHTDLITFQANVDGAKKIVALLTPVLSTAPGGTELLNEVNAQFTKVDGILAPYKQGDTYVSYEQVNDATRDQLKAAMAALSEELAEISGTMGLKVR